MGHSIGCWPMTPPRPCGAPPRLRQGGTGTLQRDAQPIGLELITIHDMPNLSATMPKRLAKKVSAIGI